MKRILRYSIIPALILVYFAALYLYEPYKLPDYFDNILFNVNLSAIDPTQHSMDTFVRKFNSWSDYGAAQPNTRRGYEDEDREITIESGFHFRRDETSFIAYHPRLNTWAANKIIHNFETDQEFLWWRLSPKSQQDEAKRHGEDTPSWADRLKFFRAAGFSKIILTNGSDNWQLDLSSVQHQ